MPITLDGTNGITTPTYGGADTSEYLVPVTQFKNRIINGAMVIDQRNAGASITANDNVFGVDRFPYFAYQNGKGTIQQNQGSVTPPAGFTNYLGFTSNSAYTVGTNESFALHQRIEGFNIADLGWGTANAKTVTLSFWVRSSLTGTFGGSICNSARNRSYPYSYSISSANTWEYKTVTITGDTTGTWLTTNGIGMYVFFSLGAGSGLSATAGAWVGADEQSATGATSVVGTNGATFYITGVQLEVGSTATSFDYRPHGTELQLCQRYFYAFDIDGLEAVPCWAQAANITNTRMMMPVTMRADPTITRTGTLGDLTKNWTVYNNGAFRTVNAITISGITNQSFRMEMTVDSGIAGADASGLYLANIGTGSPSLTASAEL